MAEEPTPRGFLSAGLDYLGSRFLNLPPEKCGYTTQAVRVPMRDGVELAADLYLPQLPEGQDAAGLIMVQCCYGRDAGIAFVNARVFAARGFKVLFVSTRGTYGSGGEFWPGRAEQSDSQDIVVWMRQQPWYPGTFATAGASYLGYSQWAFLRDPPEDCVAAAIMVAPHDQAFHVWGTGCFGLDRVGWSDLMSRRDEKKSILSNASHIPGLRFLGGRSPLTETIASLPLYSSLEKYFSERKAPWLFDYLDHPNLDDEYWTAVRHHDSLERVNIPILLISGWYDPFFTQSMAQYKRLHERGVDVKLIVGPWTHTQASGLYSMRELLEFFSEHLAKSGKYSTAPAHIYVTGAEEWTPMPSWPPATTPQTFYLQPNGTLGPDQPAEDARSLSFVFDPLSPTPALGGPMMTGGKVDDSAYATRDDVQIFTSELLTEDVKVFGMPRIQFTHSSDPPYADLFVRLSEVDTNGVSHNITQVYKALDPLRDQSQPISLELHDCAHTFRAGTRIRLIVAGGAFPMYARCLGTSEDRVRSDKVVPQKHTITVAGGLSELVLPVQVDA